MLGEQPMLAAAAAAAAGTRWRAAAIRSANGPPGASGPPRAPCHRGLNWRAGERAGGRRRARVSRQEARPPLLSRCGRGGGGGGGGRGEGALGREARGGRPSEHALPEAGAAAVSLTSPRAPRPPRFRGMSGEEIGALATGSREPAPPSHRRPRPVRLSRNRRSRGAGARCSSAPRVGGRAAGKRPLVGRPLGSLALRPCTPSYGTGGTRNRRAGGERAPLGSTRAAPSRSARAAARASGEVLRGRALPLRAPDRVLRPTRRAQPPAVTSSGCWRQCKAAGAPAARSRYRPAQSMRGPRPQGRPASVPRERKGLAQ
ncbi:translation initiation factor IF-2-like [Peromyscus leucopus]|uniref:translation initiation factor IF-2-like n=1 Tax=Peromyscus leucopus TaxID=10041 RepID=UPI001884FA5F|nr:translation initiation factor IF-2-like [Peromyscus leucopus]